MSKKVFFNKTTYSGPIGVHKKTWDNEWKSVIFLDVMVGFARTRDTNCESKLNC